MATEKTISTRGAELRIREGSRCPRCEPVAFGGDRLWLRGFLGSRAEMERLRGMLARLRPVHRTPDAEVLNQLAWLFRAGYWHVCRAEKQRPLTVAVAAPDMAAAFPLAERRQVEQGRQAEPPEPVTMPGADLVAMAGVLTQGAAGGAPTCPV